MFLNTRINSSYINKSVIGCNLHLNVNVIPLLTVETLSSGFEQSSTCCLLLQATFLTALTLMTPDCLLSCLLLELILSVFFFFYYFFTYSQTKYILMRFRKIISFHTQKRTFVFLFQVTTSSECTQEVKSTHLSQTLWRKKAGQKITLFQISHVCLPHLRVMRSCHKRLDQDKGTVDFIFPLKY